MTVEDDDDELPPFSDSLVRKLISSKNKKTSRIANDGAAAASELLRMFVLEARSRAGIEAECDKEGSIPQAGGSTKTTIEAHHISKIAAELIMDFS